MVIEKVNELPTKWVNRFGHLDMHFTIVAIQYSHEKEKSDMPLLYPIIIFTPQNNNYEFSSS